jgi:hypothetical protein
LVLAGHNSGPGNVAKAIRRSEDNKTGTFEKFTHRETQGYKTCFFLATIFMNTTKSMVLFLIE